jgi:hypothetical protein
MDESTMPAGDVVAEEVVVAEEGTMAPEAEVVAEEASTEATA